MLCTTGNNPLQGNVEAIEESKNVDMETNDSDMDSPVCSAEELSDHEDYHFLTPVASSDESEETVTQSQMGHEDVSKGDVQTTEVTIEATSSVARKQLFQPMQNPTEVSSTTDVEPDLTEVGHAGYAIVWDNVGKLVRRAQNTISSTNVYAMFANNIMVKHRISFLQMESDEYTRTLATDIPISTFLPDDDDWSRLTERMNVLVQRILVKSIPNLAGKKEEVCWHIPHQYSEESSKKSEIVSVASHALFHY